MNVSYGHVIPPRSSLVKFAGLARIDMRPLTKINGGAYCFSIRRKRWEVRFARFRLSMRTPIAEPSNESANLSQVVTRSCEELLGFQYSHAFFHDERTYPKSSDSKCNMLYKIEWRLPAARRFCSRREVLPNFQCRNGCTDVKGLPTVLKRMQIVVFRSPCVFGIRNRLHFVLYRRNLY